MGNAAQIIVPTSRPQRLSITATPAQLVNQSLSATIWVGAGTDVATNNGTPINPGTSLQWNTINNQLFVVLGSDALSQAATDVSLLVSYDTQFWQPNPVAVATAAINSGQISQDQPAYLIGSSGVTINVGAGTSGAIIDVSKYQSVRMSLVTGAGTTSAGSQIAIAWWSTSAGNDTNFAVDRIQVSSMPFSGSVVNLPCRGAFLQVFNNTSLTMSYNVVGSYRRAYRFNENNILFEYKRATLPVGVSNLPMVFPYRGPVTVTMTYPVGTALGKIRLTGSFTGNAISSNVFLENGIAGTLFATANTNMSIFRFSIPFMWSNWVFQNLTAGAVIATCAMIADADPY